MPLPIDDRMYDTHVVRSLDSFLIFIVFIFALQSIALPTHTHSHSQNSSQTAFSSNEHCEICVALHTNSNAVFSTSAGALVQPNPQKQHISVYENLILTSNYSIHDARGPPARINLISI
jgi:hypothetical protein